MKRATAFAIVIVTAAAPALSVACVDLFHSTDYATACIGGADAGCTTTDAGSSVDDADPDAVGDAKPPIDFCAWDPETARAAAYRTCAWLGACEGALGETAFGRCVVRAMLAFDCVANPSLRPAGKAHALWSCLASANACAAVHSCILGTDATTCETSPGGSFTACGKAPRDDIRFECGVEELRPDSGIEALEPCVLAGRTCSRANNSIAQCHGAGFDDGGCAASQGMSGCSGTTAVDCQDEKGSVVDIGVDCANIGAGQCFDGVNAPGCKPNPGTSCTASGDPTCEGTTATACINGEEARIDCQALGLQCDAAVSKLYDLGAACKSGECSGDDDCDGDTIRSCGRGAIYEVSCTALGLGPCRVKDGLASCSPP